ncbi:MAG: DUF2950 domain-containing protein [Dechloromonas sp.]|nr:MAG: DUF2950 domain-containing protein [Dechloromonas sp.]
MNTNKLNRLIASLLLAGAVALPGKLLAATTTAFKTPEAAMEAFGAAVNSDDEAAKEAILGKNFRAVIPPIGTEIRYKFLESWARAHKIEMESDGKARIAVGDSGWTLPIPLVKTKAGWVFDLKAGKAEIIVREIGRNELAVIKVAAAFVEAQREYARKDRNGDGVREYARKIVSTPGKQDGLYWPDEAGQEQSPLGPLLAGAAHRAGQKHPGSYHGYRYRILTSQGTQAAGGARDYVVDGHMTGGFGLIMWPAKFGETGVMTFMVNQDGQVFEKNLGPDTPTKVERLRSFNPDASWRKVDNP